MTTPPKQYIHEYTPQSIYTFNSCLSIIPHNHPKPTLGANANMTNDFNVAIVGMPPD